jgi:hypothetical protein
MIKPYQRAASSQPAEAAGRVPLGLMIIFVILFAGISSYFISSQVDDYKQHMLVRDHGTDTLASITGKNVSYNRGRTAHYLEYSSVPLQVSSRSNPMTVRGAFKTFSGESDDVDRPMFNAYPVGSKIRIRYATNDPDISFLHVDDYLDAKRFLTNEIIVGCIFEVASFFAAVFLSMLAWSPVLLWRGFREEKERKVQHDRRVLEGLTKYEPDPRRSRREDLS